MAEDTTINLGVENGGEAAMQVVEPAPLSVLIPTTPRMSNLARFIRRVFKENADHRQMSGIDQKLLDALRATKSEYSEAEKARFRATSLPTDIFTPLTVTKCRAALSQLNELFNSAVDKPWVVQATPMPEVPEFVAQEAWTGIVKDFMQIVAVTGQVPTPEQMERYAFSRMDEVVRKEVEWAKIRAERMDRKVFDQMTEGGWVDAFSEYCMNLVVYGTGIIRGPVPRVMLRSRVKSGRLGGYKYELEPREILSYEAISPWDCYPSKGAKKITDGHLCIRTRFTAKDLSQFASGKPSGAHEDGEWFADTVEALLARYPEGGVKVETQTYDLARSLLENDGPSDMSRCTMEGIEFYGDVRGSMLMQLGILKTQDGDAIDAVRYYEVDAISIADFVVYCKIINPCIGRPLSKGVFYPEPGSWWGGCIAERLNCTQRLVNAALRNLVNNMAMASGPMVFVKDAGRLVDKGPDALKIQPWKVLKFNMGGYGQTDIPIGTLNFESRLVELLRLFEAAKTWADDDSGIPAYVYGNNAGTGGALRTSSGLAMMTEAANKVMKAVMVDTDRMVVRDVVLRTVNYNMVYDTDLSIKGDCQVNPAGSIGIVLREAESNRRKQMMQLLLTPAALQILGPKPFVEVFREESKTFGLSNIDDVLPSKEKMEMLEMVQQLQQYNAAMQGQQAQIDGGGEGGEPEAEAGVNPSADSARQRMEENPQGFAVGGGNPNPNQMGGEGGVAERRAVA